MRPFATLSSLALACGVLCGALAGVAGAAPGDLISHTKISQPTLTPVGVTLTDGDEFGDNVCGLGDLDGPGPSVVAVAVAANNDNDGGSNRGAVYIFFLNSAGTILSKQKISDTQGGFLGVLDDDDQFGTALAWLGDLDGPGPSVGALAVGAINDDDGGSNRGAVWICYLNANGTVLSHAKISNTSGGFTGVIDNGDEFGGAVCSLGDLDGPGPGALAIGVGANRDDDGGLDRGAAWILYLDSAGQTLSHTKISSTAGVPAVTDTDGFAEKLVDLGDLDGAGPSVRAMASSAVSDDDGGNDHGAVYVVFLNAAGGVVSYQKISDTAGNFDGLIQDDDGFGSGVAFLGDIDGNGPSVGAMAVGLANADGNGFDKGHVYILFLDNTGNCLSYTEVGSTTGTLAGQIDDTDSFGSSMDVAGDIDGSGGGAQTLLVGVGLDDDGGVNRGAAYLCKIDGVSASVGVGDRFVGKGPIGIAQLRPNPFRESGTTVAFRLSAASRVQIDVLDLGGRMVRRLVDRSDAAGEYRVTWDGRDDAGRPLATGAYLVRMTLDGRTVAGAAKAVLLR
jgi:hypothetical protein